MKAPIIALLAVLAVPALASAHVVAAPGEAKADSYSAIAFRVGHACAAGDTTLKVRVEVPDGVASARPPSPRPAGPSPSTRMVSAPRRSPGPAACPTTSSTTSRC